MRNLLLLLLQTNEQTNIAVNVNKSSVEVTSELSCVLFYLAEPDKARQGGESDVPRQDVRRRTELQVPSARHCATYSRRPEPHAERELIVID